MLIMSEDIFESDDSSLQSASMLENNEDVAGTSDDIGVNAVFENFEF
jgi:hypothetical protein